MRRLVSAALALLLAGHIAPAGQRRRSEDQKRQERIQELSRELARCLAWPSPGEEQKFLHARAAALLERLKTAAADSYVFDRLSRAAEDLLEASEEIEEGREPPRPPKEGEREETARELQRYYFRVQQAEYFAGLSGESDAAAYVRHARALYQQGRSAYDAQHYRRARKLAEAAALVVSALERLAQARISSQEPPRIP
ncbi:MAG: hypothetical protein RMI94_07460 [Bryobacterales bacterium]|nr:hypothetical protein [Bryobacteraceae bacterium]MDW8130371.1 hypothetical protein [Bryobacterales bacterium]